MKRGDLNSDDDLKLTQVDNKFYFNYETIRSSKYTAVLKARYVTQIKDRSDSQVHTSRCTIANHLDRFDVDSARLR